MTRPENQDDLLRWVGAFAQLDTPLIVKFHGQDERAHLLSVLQRTWLSRVFQGVFRLQSSC